MCGITPPLAIIALINESNSSSPQIVSDKWCALLWDPWNISCQLQHISCEVLQNWGTIHSRNGTHLSMAYGASFQDTSRFKWGIQNHFLIVQKREETKYGNYIYNKELGTCTSPFVGSGKGFNLPAEAHTWTRRYLHFSDGGTWVKSNCESNQKLRETTTLGDLEKVELSLVVKQVLQADIVVKHPVRLYRHAFTGIGKGLRAWVRDCMSLKGGIFVWEFGAG